MEIQNMKSPNGNDVPNQFVITSTNSNDSIFDYPNEIKVFQSYETNISLIDTNLKSKTQNIKIDHLWNYSRTTTKYLCQFLRYYTGKAINGKKDIQDKIDSGEYTLTNLN